MEPGECTLVLSNQIHSIKSQEGSLVWIAVFSEDFVPEFAAHVRQKQGTKISFFPDEETIPVLEQVMLGNPGDLLLKSVLYLVCDQYLKKVPMEPKKVGSERLICEILDYVTAHYRENISLHTVAEHFGYEYHYLSRLLNQSYNIRFKDFLNQLRVSYAISLLEKGSQCVTEIALECGFQSIRSFNQVFKESVGVAPSEYRRK